MLDPLAELRAMCQVRAVIEEQVRIAAERALRTGADRSAVAHALGLSRSHLYRKFTGQFGHEKEEENTL